MRLFQRWKEGKNFVLFAHRKTRDYVRGGSEGALAPPEFAGSEKRTEGETDNLLLKAPPESKA